MEHRERLNTTADEIHGQYAVPQAEQIAGRSGHRPFQIGKEQLEYLWTLSFTWVSISKMLMVSQMTICRSRVEYDMILDDNDSTSMQLSDYDLMALVQRTIRLYPMARHSFIWGIIRSHGFLVTRERLRHAIHTCDPINTTLR